MAKTLGGEWVYVSKVGDSESWHAETHKLVEADEDKDVTRLTIDIRKEGRDVVESRIDMTPGGLVLLKSRGRDLPTPRLYLKYPTRAGEEWECKTPGVGSEPPVTVRFKTVGEEKVVVPFGAFNALRVDNEFKEGERTIRVERWYLRDVGMIKTVIFIDDRPNQFVELKSFKQTKGPEKK